MLCYSVIPSVIWGIMLVNSGGSILLTLKRAAQGVRLNRSFQRGAEVLVEWVKMGVVKNPCKMGQKRGFSEIVVEWVKKGFFKILVKWVKKAVFQNRCRMARK